MARPQPSNATGEWPAVSRDCLDVIAEAKAEGIDVFPGGFAGRELPSRHEAVTGARALPESVTAISRHATACSIRRPGSDLPIGACL